MSRHTEEELEKIRWNVRVSPVLALGKISACWNIVASMGGYEDEDEETRILVSKIHDALDEYDNVVRARLRKQGW